MSKFGMLGKGRPKLDSRVAALHNRAGIVQPIFPPECNWSTNMVYGMLANDQYGDCTCAAVYHMLQTFDKAAGKIDWQPTDQEALALYTIVGGWPTQDNGAVETDVLNFWATHGVPGHDGKPVQIQYMRVDEKQQDWVRYAISEFGGLYIGLNLPRSAQAQLTVGGQWDVVNNAPQRMSAPGSWGGHAVNIVGYDELGFTCVTWGDTQYMTNAFFDEYCDEAYCVVCPDWTVPKNLDADALAADMAKIRAAA